MSKLVFKVAADYERVIKLKEEIAKLKKEINSFDVNRSRASVKVLVGHLGEATKEFNKLTLEAAKTGTLLESELKQKVYDSSQVVNNLTQKILDQKIVIREVEADVRKLADAYGAVKDKPLKANIALGELSRARIALQKEKAALFSLQMEQSNARLSVKKLRDEYSLYKDEVKKVVNVNEGTNFSFKKVLAGIGGVAVFKQLTSNVIKVRGEYQAMQTAMETMVGKDKAGNLMSQIKEYSKISPLGLKDVSAAAQTMLGFNLEAEKVPGFIKAIGDVSMGESQKFNSLTLAFSQISAAGKLSGQDLNQLINGGFNPLQIISEKTGKSMAELKEEMARGTISAEMIQRAFIDATSSGGRFYQMSENASKTLNGQISILQDALNNTFNEIGEKSEGVISGGIELTTTLVQNYDLVGSVLLGLVEIYGVYRTALIVNSVLEQGMEQAVWAKVKATKAAIIAQSVYNKVLALNPWVLAGMAVVSLGIVMWNLADHTSAAERAQERYNKKVEQANEKEKDRKTKLEELVAELENVYTAEFRKLEILAILEGEYPTFFKHMFDEQGHVKNLTEAWRAYNEEVAKDRVADNAKKVNDLRNRIKLRQDEIDFRSENYGNGQHRNFIDKTPNQLKKEVKQLQTDIVPYEKQLRQDQFNQWQIDLKKQTDDQIKAELEEAKRIQAARKTIKGMIIPVTLGTMPGAYSDEEVGNRVSVMEQELKFRTGGTSYAQDLETARKEWESTKKEFEKIEKDKAKFTTKQYEDAKKAKEEAEKKYKDLGGDVDTDSRANSIAGQKTRISALEEKQAKDRARLAEDLENQVEQSRIDAMADGFEKTQAQRELDNKREIEALKKQKEDYRQTYIQLQKDLFDAQEELKKTKDPDYKPKTFDSSGIELPSSADALFGKMESNTLSKQASEATGYFNSLLDKYQDYDAKRKKIEEEFARDYIALEKQRPFRDSKQIDAAQGELNYKKDEAMELVTEEFASREDTFQAWMDGIADMTLEQLGVVLRQAQNELGNLEIAGKGGTQLAVARQKVQNAQEAIDKEKAKKKKDSPDKRTLKDWKDLNDVLEDTGASFKEIGDSVGGVVGDIMSAAGEMTASSLKMISGILTLANWSSQAISTTSETASKSIQSVEKASIVLAVISAALQVAMKIASLITGKSKAEQDSERLNKVTDKMAQTQDVVNKLIERRVELIKDATAAEKGYVAQLSKTAIDVQKAQNEKLFQKLLDNDFLAKKGKDNNLSLRDLGITSIEELDEFMGSEKLLNYLNNGYGIRDSSSWEEILKNSDNLIQKGKEIEATWKESITGMTLDDAKEVLDDFLLDVDATEKDIADSFEDYMKQAILNAVKTQYLNKALEGWYEDFFNKMKDGELSKEESEALKNKYLEINQIAQDRIDSMLESAGISTSSSEEQSATSKGFEAMSQETGEELNGRFTALQMAGEEIKNQNILQTQALETLTFTAGALLTVNSEARNIADETRSILANSYLELTQISANTKAIIIPIGEMNEKLDKIQKNTENL